MADYLPKHQAGDTITVAATAAVTGGQNVNALGAPAGADATNVIGVAGKDAAIGESFPVWSGGVQRVTAAGAIAAGANVKAAAAGKVATFVNGTDGAEKLLGIALAAAAADGNIIPVKYLR